MNTNTLHTTALPVTGRILMAAIFVLSGVGKLMAPAAAIGYIQAMGLPLAGAGLVAAIVVELGGGLLLALGYKTRLVALVLAAFSVVTGLVFHSAVGDQNQMIHLMKNLAMAGGLLQVVAFGAGAYSLDAKAANAAVGRVSAA